MIKSNFCGADAANAAQTSAATVTAAVSAIRALTRAKLQQGNRVDVAEHHERAICGGAGGHNAAGTAAAAQIED